MHFPNQKYKIQYYESNAKYCPYREWLESLDKRTKKVLSMRITRMIDGNFGNCHDVGDGIWELIIQFGPGYRIYYKFIDNNVVLILHGGSKRSQQKDINKAKLYWHQYKVRIDTL